MDEFSHNNNVPLEIKQRNQQYQLTTDSEKKGSYRYLYWLFTLAFIFIIWQLAAWKYDSELLMPTPAKALAALFFAVQDVETLKNLLITLRRVLTGFGCAVIIGVPLGYLMGYSQIAMRLFDPLIGSLRQIPIMAWVPLTIVWFGLGDGPTIFLIAFSGVFPIIINTMAGVQGISRDYYNAAKSMGAGPFSIFVHVMFPASLPDILTGMRIAASAGWMSVICAEFIATSAGFGYSMIQAQTLMRTDLLIALMIMAAIIGYSIDRMLMLAHDRLGAWKYI